MAGRKEFLMDGKPGYANLLRPVGQVLEALHVESFSLKVEGDDFLVSGKAESAKPSEATEEKGFRVVWQILRGRHPAQKEAPASTPSSGVIEMRYRPGDIERLEQEGRAKRRDPEGKADAHTLSQLLRVVGAFVDQKAGRLLNVTKETQTVEIEYVGPDGRTNTEEFAVSILYDLWVRMFLKRGGRSKS